MFMAFIITLFVIVLSKCNSCSKDKRELQEEPITPMSFIIEHLSGHLGHLSVNHIWQFYDRYCSVYSFQNRR